MTKKNISIVSIIAVLIILAGGGFYFFNSVRNDDKKHGLQENEQLYVVSRGDLMRSVTISGNLRYGNVTDLSFVAAGKIDRVNYTTEDPVRLRKGELIASLDDQSVATLKLERDKASQALDLSEKELSNFIGVKQVQRLAAAAELVKESQINLNSAQEELDSLNHFQDEKNSAEHKALLAKKSLEESRATLADLDSLYPNSIATLDQLALESEKRLEDAEKKLEDIRHPYKSENLDTFKNALAAASSTLYSAQISQALADNDISNDLAAASSTLYSAQISQALADNDISNDLAAASSTLYSAQISQALADNETFDSITKSEKVTADAEKEYLAYITKWFGVNDLDLLQLSPADIYTLWDINLNELYDSLSKSKEIDDFAANFSAEDDLQTPWNEATILSQLTLYRERVVGTCSESTVIKPLAPNVLCVDKELEDSWQILKDSRNSLLSTNLEANKSKESHRESVRKAKESLMNIKIEASKISETHLESVRKAKESLMNIKIEASKISETHLESVRKAKESLIDAEKKLDEFLYPKVSEINRAIAEHEIAVSSRKFAQDNASRAQELHGSNLETQKYDVAIKEHLLAEALRELEEVNSRPTIEEIESAQLSLTRADSELQDAKQKLLDSKKPDGFSLAVLESEISKNKLLLEEKENALEGALLKAPFDCILLNTYVAPGTEVKVGQPAAQIAALDSIDFQGEVGEGEILLVNDGMETQIVMDADKGVEVAGKVKDISPISKSEGGVVRYKVTISLIDIPSQLLVEGLTSVAKVVLEKEQDRILVPLDSIKQKGTQTFVRVYEGGSINERSVELGINDDFWVAVVKGLNEKESIVITSMRSSSEKFEIDWGEDGEDSDNGKSRRR